LAGGCGLTVTVTVALDDSGAPDIFVTKQFRAAE
jgi:hypothetical protein